MGPVRGALWTLAGAAAWGCGTDAGTGTGNQQTPSPNYVHLQSDAGDYIGQGRTYEYTQANAVITVTASGGHLSITVNGDEGWFGDFEVPSALNQLQPGDYTGIERYPFHDPAMGGLDWFGEGRGCNTLSGWFAIDSVTYVTGAVTKIDLRFEQHCEGGTSALHGSIHWRADDTTAPPGPVNPPPAGLWSPAAGSTPSSGNYVYLQSDVGDYIGQGATSVYTDATSSITLTANGGHLSVGVAGWSGNFQTMNTLTTLEPGYYGALHRYPFHNPVKGGLDWSGQGRGCNTLTGWFAIDHVTYINGSLTALDLRFEQHCEGGSPALHGAIHWQS